MNTIKWVSLKKENTRRTPRIRYIEIKHESGFLTLKDTLNAPKIAQSNNSIVLWLDDKTKTRELKGFNHYSKEQLENFQKTILFAYVFVNEELDEAISNSESKNTLDEIKEKLLAIREQLKLITRYIDDYENLLEEYKEV